eukprot:786039-Prymnesium_polylepis.1
MIADIVTDEWTKKWKIEKTVAKWAGEWGVVDLTAADICDALFQQPPLEWSRITPFQDPTLGHFTVKIHCTSPHNLGARELAEELNGVWPGLLQMADIQSEADLRTCDHVLVYLNANTWTHEPEEFAAEDRQAMLAGLHLQLCHEFPSVLDVGSARGALELKSIMDMTPSDLKTSPTNVYSQIAISLKGGSLREPGLANLAERLAQRSGRGKTTYSDASVGALRRGAVTPGLLSRLRSLESSDSQICSL